MQTLHQKPFTTQAPRVVRGQGATRKVACLAQAKPVQARVAEAAGVIAALSTAAPMAQAAELFNSANVDSSALTFAVGGGAAVVGLAGLLVATDPQKR
jgi:hypothetical protein